MDLYNLVTKIPYLVMLGIGLVIVLQLHLGGLNDLSADIDTASEEEYRQAIVMENLLTTSVQATETDVSISEWDNRRAFIPEEFILNEDPSEDEIGFSVRDDHCYIERVEGLDGVNFGFGVTANEDSQYAEALDPIECVFSPDESSAWSHALMLREDNPPLEVIIHVYRI